MRRTSAAEAAADLWRRGCDQSVDHGVVTGAPALPLPLLQGLLVMMGALHNLALPREFDRDAWKVRPGWGWELGRPQFCVPESANGQGLVVGAVVSTLACSTLRGQWFVVVVRHHLSCCSWHTWSLQLAPASPAWAAAGGCACCHLHAGAAYRSGAAGGGPEQRLRQPRLPPPAAAGQGRLAAHRWGGRYASF